MSGKSFWPADKSILKWLIMRKRRCQNSSENVRWSHLCIGWSLFFASCPLSLWIHIVFCLTVNILHTINFFHYIWDFLQYKIATSNCTLIFHLQNNPDLLHFVAHTYSTICLLDMHHACHTFMIHYLLFICYNGMF